MSFVEGATDLGEEPRDALGHGAALWQRPVSVRVRLDEPGMEAAIRATSVYCASIAPDLTAERRACEEFLVRLLRSRLRLVRTEILSRRLRDPTDDERLHYAAREKNDVYSQIYFRQHELTCVNEGLAALGRLREGGLTEAEKRLLLRCTVLGQAVQAKKRAHSELVRVLNSRRGAEEALKRRGSGQGTEVTYSGRSRMRFREWTVRAAIFGAVSYMRHYTAPLFWKRAYKLLDRMIWLRRDVIVSQVRHGKPGQRLREGGVVERGLGIEPNKQAYITPGFDIEEIWVMREGLEFRDGETRLNPTEEVLLMKVKLLEGAKYGAEGRRLGWRLGGLSKRKRVGPRAKHW